MPGRALGFDKAMAIGDAMRPDTPSDHAPLSVSISRKRVRHPALQAPLSAAVCRTDEFTEEVIRMAQYSRADPPAFVAIDAFKSVFREAARRAAARLEQKRNLPAALMAQTALAVLRASRRCDGEGVSRGSVEQGLGCLLGPRSARCGRPGRSARLRAGAVDRGAGADTLPNQRLRKDRKGRTWSRPGHEARCGSCGAPASGAPA